MLAQPTWPQPVNKRGAVFLLRNGGSADILPSMTSWPDFLTPPRLIELVGAACALAFGWLKRKTITTALGATRRVASERFWAYIGRKVQANGKAASTNEKTYRGTFVIYSQYANYPHEYFFELVNNGVTTKVPVMKTNLLSGVQRGEHVEIDTRIASLTTEAVLRVRVSGQ